ncbi:hypothetical protein BS17DRAFT_331741 [Gyrodon lividus]|nr:hypothetical protein BS17DRAFT_331741 [Gyrodon lividus]
MGHPPSINNPLLALLSAISSTSSGNAPVNPSQHVPNAVLLSALQGLLATNPHLLQPATGKVGCIPGANQQARQENDDNGNADGDDADSDIVILDSSTVDASAFRKRTSFLSVDNGGSDRNRHSHSPLSIQDSELPTSSSQGTSTSPMPASTPPSGQESTPAPSQTSTPHAAPESTSRRLSDANLNTEAPPSKAFPPGGIMKGNMPVTPPSYVPTTPTPSRTRQRTLGECIQGQVYPSTSISRSPGAVPSSPSPSGMRASNSVSGLTNTMRQRRVHSSPTAKTRMRSSPSVRLPSILGSMRAAMTPSNSRLQLSHLSPSTHASTSSLATNKNAKQSTALLSSLTKLDGPTDATISSNSTTLMAATATLKRKRTLGEFMAEYEAHKRERAKKRSPSGRGSDVPVSTTKFHPAQPRPTFASTSRRAQSSPPRPLFGSYLATPLPISNFQPGFVLSSAFFDPSFSSTSTSASTSITAPTTTTKNPLKNFVLPAWARTSTATLPRLSEEALARQRAEQEANKVQTLKRRKVAQGRRIQRSGIHIPSKCPSKESSDEDDEGRGSIRSNAQAQRPPSSSMTSAQSQQPFFPVFASDAVEPIPSLPPQSKHPHPLPPTTPPRNHVVAGTGTHRTPGKSGPGSGSLFTPSGQGSGSLFTPSTPSATRSLSRFVHTPRSPSMLHHSISSTPRKSVLQTPRTPKRGTGSLQTLWRNAHTSKNLPPGSPSSITRTPRTHMGKGTRTFLLPPHSPCVLRTPQRQKQEYSGVSVSSSALAPTSGSTWMQKSSLSPQNVEQEVDRTDEDMLIHELDEALQGLDVPTYPVEDSGHATADNDCRSSEEDTKGTNDSVNQAEEVFAASSPLPPSSPLQPTSPFSSPSKDKDPSFDIPIMSKLLVPDSDILLRVSNCDGPTVKTAWISDTGGTAAWFSDSDASAWFTETEGAWLTDTERGPLLTDSDAAWFSDSDAVFGDMSSVPPSTASNWLSDDANVDTDGEVGAISGRSGALDAAAFEEAFAALTDVEPGDEGGGRTTQEVEVGNYSEFWEAMRPLIGIDEEGKVPDAGSVDQEKLAQGIQGLLSGVVGDRLDGNA